tara:strand:+ start:1198 stop:1659 length:462 start_codon:yes stop_codon:yes gene_type:complete
VSDSPHFIDFAKVLNQSTAGAKAQKFLKDKFVSDSKKFRNLEKKLLEEEREIIAKKKVLNKDEYQTKVGELRKKVAKLQKDKQNSLSNIAKLRASAKNQLLEKLKPILRTYMEGRNIRLVIDKKEVLYGDQNLEITKDIIDLLNKEVKELNLK